MATCYVCRRTEQDTGPLIDSSTEQLQKEFDHEQKALEQALQQHVEEYGQIAPVLETVDSKYRNMAVKTIAGDLKAFSELIPNVEPVLAECKKVPHYTANKTINELIEETRPENNSRVQSLRRKMADIKARGSALEESGVPFHTTEIRIRDAYGWMEEKMPAALNQARITVSLCPVCIGVMADVARNVVDRYVR